MAEILFVTWDGGGNVPPALGIARELVRRGHGVRFLGHETQRAAIESAGFVFTAYATAEPFSCLGANPPERIVALFTDRALGGDAVAEARQRPTDVVIVDCLLVGALRACADAGLTYVTLEHLFDGFLRRAWLSSPIGQAAVAQGLDPVASWDSAAVTLVASLPALDPGYSPDGPDSKVWTGPVLTPPAPHDLAAHDAAVLVSLSTYNFPGMATSLQNILDATAGLDARVVVTTGPVVDPAQLRPSANHEVHRYVDHDELMPSMSLVVGHGGHATTMRALAHDLPLVVMPMHPFLDQPMVGAQVEAVGAGRLVAKDAAPEQLRPVIAALLADGPHRRAAASIGAQIRASAGTTTAADRVLGAVRDGVAPAGG